MPMLVTETTAARIVMERCVPAAVEVKIVGSIVQVVNVPINVSPPSGTPPWPRVGVGKGVLGIIVPIRVLDIPVGKGVLGILVPEYAAPKITQMVLIFAARTVRV